MFDFLKKNIQNTSLLQGATDVHSHLLPGVDDGFPDNESSQEAISFLEEVGIKRIIFTPHIMEDLTQNRASFLKERFQQFTSTTQTSIQFHLAAEYMLDASFEERLNEEILGLDEKHILVETSYFSGPPNLYDLLYQITLKGYVPVIAHAERYLYMKDEEINHLRGLGCELQMNLMSLAGIYGKGIGKRALNFLHDGWYTYIGSDIHRLSPFQHALKQIKLNSKERAAMQQLFENNHRLF